MLSIPIFFGITGMLFLLFPTGRPLSRAWRGYSWVFGAVVALAGLSYGLIPGELGPGIENPFAVSGEGARVVAWWPT